MDFTIKYIRSASSNWKNSIRNTPSKVSFNAPEYSFSPIYLTIANGINEIPSAQ